MSKCHGRNMLAAVATLVFLSFGAGCGSGSKGGSKLVPGGGESGEGGEGGGGGLTPEQETGATALCEKAADCAGETNPSSAEMNQCVNQAAGALQIFPDPDGFSDCINGLTCSQLQDSASLKKCVDFDFSSFVCSDSSSLYGCSNSGKCTTISCTDVCTLLGGTFDHCGASNDSTKAKNICWCRK